MKKLTVILKATMLAFLFSSFSVQAATPAESIVMDSIEIEQLYLVVKTNNIEYVGYILQDDGREVLISTEKLGKIYIPKADIRAIQKISDTRAIIRGEYFAAGPFVTRYIFTTNALPISKGMNYARINLYGPEVHFALSDNFSFGILTTWAVSPFIISGKYSFSTKNPKVNYSVGTLMGNSGYMNNMKTWGGLHYGNVTYGTPKDNITFGAGYGYLVPGVTETEAPEGIYYTSTDYYSAQIERPTYPAKVPIFSFSGITKVGSKASFIFDSMLGFVSVKTTMVNTTSTGFDTRYIVQDGIERVNVLILMPGMRFQTKDNSAFQISLNTIKVFNPRNTSSDENTTFPLPSCSWFYRF
jgi:hypothetical protein